LLEKNASEKKSGAGQYFTPRVLIDVIVQLMAPQVGERCADPAAGTFGFMIAADNYLKAKTDDYFDLDDRLITFQREEAFVGMELVKETHRLALMNALLHDINGRLEQGDTLSSNGKWMKNLDVILTNPPFGMKKGGERVTRDDLTFETSNKQLNFLQVIYNALKADGKARAAVVLPDNVLFESGVGAQIRRDLMNKCNLHTILRLPTGIFYAQGVKTNVLFFTRGTSDQGNTKDVWVYDLRTNMPKFGKRTPLTLEHFTDFITAYTADDRSKVDDERWHNFTREEIAKKDDSLDIGLIADESLSSYENLPDPIASTEEAIAKLQQAMELLGEVAQELKAVEEKEDVS
jgi:type I restriction enzyme M protein